MRVEDIQVPRAINNNPGQLFPTVLRARYPLERRQAVCETQSYCMKRCCVGGSGWAIDSPCAVPTAVLATTKIPEQRHYLALTSAIAYGCGASGLRGRFTNSLISGSGTLRNGLTAIKMVP